MKRVTNKIENIMDLSRVMNWLSAQNEFPMKAEFSDWKANRSAAQNRLAWMWHTEEANHDGEMKDYCHERFKYKYVLPILLRDDDNGKLNELWSMAKVDKRMVAAIVNIISTTHLDTAQFSEALNEYDITSSQRGLLFTHPGDYREAMGEK